MSAAVTSTLTSIDGVLCWLIHGWRGPATANAARRGKLRQRLRLLAGDRRSWDTLLAVALRGRTAPGLGWDRIGSYTLLVTEWGRPERDGQAVLESTKRGVDALVRAGFLADDGPPHVSMIVWATPAYPDRFAEGIELILRRP